MDERLSPAETDLTTEDTSNQTIGRNNLSSGMSNSFPAFKPLRIFIAALGLSLTACPPTRLPDECRIDADCRRFFSTTPGSGPNQWMCLDEEEVVLNKQGHVDHVKHSGRKVCELYCGH